MASFELALPVEPIQKTADVLMYAEFAQSKLENHKDPNFNNFELNEIASHLDRASHGVYFSSAVAIAGIHRMSVPVSEDPDQVRQSLKDGLVEGTSQGFAVRPVEEFAPSVWQDDFDAQQEIYERLRGDVAGEYAVCHLITHKSVPVLHDDYSRMVMNHFTALAPIRSSSLHIYGENDLAVGNTILENADVLLSGLDKPSRRALRSIENEFLRHTDPLKSITASAPQINRIVSRNKAPVISALCARLAGGPDGELMTKAYAFKEMPPVIYNDYSDNPFARLEEEALKVIYINGLSTASQYYVDGSGKAVILENPSVCLYLNMVSIIHPGQMEEFSVPLNLIEPGSFRRISV